MSKQKEYINGGLADGIPNKFFSHEQLMKGMKVEREHTSNDKIAMEISRDHLTEDPEYYIKLEKMEKKKKKK